MDSKFCNKNGKSSHVIAVDLDGTLIFTDTLHESILKLLKKNLLKFFCLPIYLLKGRAYLKHQLSRLVKLDLETLPYNSQLIEWLKKEKKLGKSLILCTGANIQVANYIANHLQLFDEVIASDININNTGPQKRDFLNKKYGIGGYDYIGNSIEDIPVWAAANHAVLVNPNFLIQKKAKKASNVIKTFASHKQSFKDWFNVLRVHQQLKNLLLFVPIIASHQLDNSQNFFILINAFLSFGLCASALYIFNDLLDLDSDRRHPRKYIRPFASGNVKILYGVSIFPVLIFTSFILGFLIGFEFIFWLALYFLLTSLYTLKLKRIIFLDCLILASLYTLRIIAGAAAVDIFLSFWLLAFSIFIFLSLAFLKRYSELLMQYEAGSYFAHGRGYSIDNLLIVRRIGIVSGALSVLVLMFYLQSEQAILLYMQPAIIWLAMPLLSAWIFWIWHQTLRGFMHEDPIIFAIKDRMSIIILFLLIATFVFAKFGVGIS